MIGLKHVKPRGAVAVVSELRDRTSIPVHTGLLSYELLVICLGVNYI